MNDIQDNYFNVEEYFNIRAFLYSPASDLLGEVVLTRPKLALKLYGFGLLDFELPEFYFNEDTTTLDYNDKINDALDGYELEVWFGNIPEAKYQIIKFLIKSRPVSFSDNKTKYSYSAITNEAELLGVPIINWPGIKVMEYEQTTSNYVSDAAAASTPRLETIALTNTADIDTILVYRTLDYAGIAAVPLRLTVEATAAAMAEEEFFIVDGDSITVWVPGNMSIPDSGGTPVWSSPEDEYYYQAFYETDEVVTIVPGSMEESPYYQTDGLTIDVVLKDLFDNVNPEFLGWTFGTCSELAKTQIRSGLNFSSTNVHAMIMSLGQNFQVFIEFDRVNRVVNAMMPSEYGANRGLSYEYGKYMKDIKQDFNSDNVVNYVQGIDGENVGFADASWSGDNYYEDYSYYLDGATWNGASLDGTSRWLSTALATVLATARYQQDLYTDEVHGTDLTLGLL